MGIIVGNGYSYLRCVPTMQKRGWQRTGGKAFCPTPHMIVGIIGILMGMSIIHLS